MRTNSPSEPDSHYNGCMEDLQLPDAQVLLASGFLDADIADRLFGILMHEIQWEERKVFVWGKWHVQPRLVAWYGDNDARYSYSGNSLTPLPWTAALTELRERVASAAGTGFNSVLLNLYRNNRDRMGWHSDDEPELGRRPTIASVSLGATRELLFKRRSKKSRGIHRVALQHGSLLLMRGDTQKNWLHAINSESMHSAPRINLTFRSISHPSSQHGSSAT